MSRFIVSIVLLCTFFAAPSGSSSSEPVSVDIGASSSCSTVGILVQFFSASTI